MTIKEFGDEVHTLSNWIVLICVGPFAVGLAVLALMLMLGARPF